jgi:hypothetical protein
MWLSDKSSVLKLFSWKIFVGKCPSNLLLDMSKMVKEDSLEKYLGTLPVSLKLYPKLIVVSERSFENEEWIEPDIEHPNKLRTCS